MKLAIQYLSDPNGNPKAVQLPIKEWEKLMTKLHKYEQNQRIKSQIREGLKEVEQAKKSKTKLQTLSQFLDEL